MIGSCFVLGSVLTLGDQANVRFGERDPHVRYYDVMADVENRVRQSLKAAQEARRPYVMFIHGWSTSRRGQTTARSVVRGFIRSKEATPLVVRADCIQHKTVFIAKIRPKATELPGGRTNIRQDLVRGQKLIIGC